MIFQGNDGGSAITALTLDMSEAGAATFNAGVTAVSGVFKNAADATGTTIKVQDNADRGITITSPISNGAAAGRIATSGTANSLEVGVRDYPTALTIAGGSGAATFTGAITANAGVVVDNITIDGNEIDVSSGNLTLDVAGTITLDADNTGTIYLSDGGTNYGLFFQDSNRFFIQSQVSDADMLFRGSDAGTVFTALTLDMSAAGTAIFNHDIEMADAALLRMGAGGDFIATSDGSNALLYSNNGNFVIDSAGEIYLDADGGDIIFQDGGSEFGRISKTGSDLTLDVAGDIILDADGGDIRFLDGGTEFGRVFLSSNNFYIQSRQDDKDMYFQGIDGGSAITALRLDMSEAGAATFNAGATFGGNITATAAAINGQLNVTGTTNSNNIYAQQLSTQFDTSSFMRFHPTSVTNSGGFTNIFFGTDTANNYGVAVGGKREGTDGEPSFAVRTLNDSTTGIEVLNITNAGEVTKPYQPAFCCKPSGAQNNMATGGVVIAFGSELFDIGANFASNQFTAPVTGKYFLNVSVRLDQVPTDPNYIEVKIVTSNNTFHWLFDPDGFDSSPTYFNAQNSVVCNMDANDTAYIQFNQNGGTAQVDCSTESHFSGNLVC